MPWKITDFLPIFLLVLGTLQDMIVDKFHISGKRPFSIILWFYL